eukprot:scaffold173222_cov30-Tisochrysis_lutea.AAC.3
MFTSTVACPRIDIYGHAAVPHIVEAAGDRCRAQGTPNPQAPQQMQTQTLQGLLEPHTLATRNQAQGSRTPETEETGMNEGGKEWMWGKGRSGRCR